MQIIEFTADSLRFVEAFAAQPPAGGFVWVFLERSEWAAQWPALQRAALQLGGSPLLDLHAQDLSSASHPSHYDYTSVYDLIIFRRLATQAETQAEAAQQAAIEAYHGQGGQHRTSVLASLPAFERIHSRAVGFAVFDRLLVSVHPSGCTAAKQIVERLLADAQLSVDAASVRNRIPLQPADLALRMINSMVDAYLALRKDLTAQLEGWQRQLFRPGADATDWGTLLAARSQLQVLQDLCEEQHDAMQEWLDSLRDQPVAAFAPLAVTGALGAAGAVAAGAGAGTACSAGAQPAASSATAPAQAASVQTQVQAQAQRDLLVARARDVVEHIERVASHARRLEQSAETAVQMHFSAQSHRTNDIMRTLTAITAIFLPLNLITGFFGMNFEALPLIHDSRGVWLAIAVMVLIATGLVLVFWRKRYLARTRS